MNRKTREIYFPSPQTRAAFIAGQATERFWDVPPQTAVDFLRAVGEREAARWIEDNLLNVGASKVAAAKARGEE